MARTPSVRLTLTVAELEAIRAEVLEAIDGDEVVDPLVESALDKIEAAIGRGTG